jgi:hypothetical protein
MSQKPPTPLPINWVHKYVGSARSGIDNLPDGRLHCWIEHEIIRNVTPAMLAWWFGHINGNAIVDGVAMNRYRVWHPCDHILHEYLSRNPDGSVGVGCKMHIVEMLGRQPEHLVDIRAVITKLDETGFGHHDTFLGLPLVCMNYHFDPVPEGTLYRNTLTIGFEGRLGRPFNRLVRSRVVHKTFGEAWIKHNIEEVGNFEFFLPALYASRSDQPQVSINK